MENASLGADAELIARRAASFGGQAAAYAAERPGYPDAAVRWALEPVSGHARLRVLDLAAGTGKLTQGLLRYAAQVVAVEPDSAMRAQFRRHLPDVRTLAGTAEAIPLEDESVDAVVVGQAIHWFDLDRAVPEIARVLAPGGVLAGLWNLDNDAVPWVRGLKEAARSSVSRGRWEPGSTLLRRPEFPAFERAEFAHAQRRTPESMAATIATQSHVLVLPEPERSHLIARVLGYLRSRPETAAGEFDLPIVTAVLRAVRP